MAIFNGGYNTMYSWKTIRTVAAILLLMPLVHLAFLVSREALAALDSSPRVWDAEIEAYAKADRLAERAINPVVIVGGRRVLLWQDVEDVLAPTPVLMRGLGDATVEDIIYHYKRLIAFYQPRTVVLLPSNSEFHIRAMNSAEDMVNSIQKLIELDFTHRKSGKFYIFTPVVTQLYPQDRAKIENITEQLTSWAHSNQRIEVLDSNRILSDANGVVKPDYFRPDGVNLNEQGYTRLSMILLNQIELDRTNPGIESLSNTIVAITSQQGPIAP